MRRLLLLTVLIAVPGCIAGSDGNHPAPEPADEPRLVCVGHVDVENGVIALRPVRSGRLVELAAREGQEVRTGAVLLRLDDTAARIGVRQAEANLITAQLRLTQARQAPAERERDLAAQRALLMAARSRRDAARHTLTRTQQLRGRDLVSEAELHVAEDAVREMEAAVEAEAHKLARMGLSDSRNTIAQAEAEVESRKALCDEAREALAECILRAPADGEVLRVLVAPGALLTTQTALLFCPCQPRIVRAEVPQEFAAGVAVGQAAVLEDDSQPGQVWKGRVVRVSDWFTPRRSVLQEPQQRNDVRTLECIIQPDSDPRPLRIGQRMRVVLAPK
jgi:multidrug resistance efflux pump